MKFLKTLAAIDAGVAFRENQTLYRTKISGVVRGRSKLLDLQESGRSP
jgi:hypothetical protein